jgi:membrane protease YdiL (CAAX protease family)
MEFSKRHLSIKEAVICSFAFMLFAFFIHFKFPVNLISFFALLLPAYLISKNLNSLQDLRKITGEIPTLNYLILFTIIGLSGGLGLGIMYRWHLDAPLIPKSIQWFAITAALVGSMEELVFRGYIQDSVKNYGPVISVSISTFSHTAYKCCLFISPMALMKTDIGFLAFWTVLAGLIYGTIRHYSKSIIPSLVGHALFDILVYAEFVKAPWWVW